MDARSRRQIAASFSRNTDRLIKRTIDVTLFRLSARWTGTPITWSGHEQA